MTKKKTNKKQETEIVVVLDRSGSMESIAKATVDGFNEFLKEQKNSEGKAFMTLVQFDDRYEMDYKSIPVSEVKQLVNGETFNPRGTTAMFDAIGKTITELNTDRDVVFVIITDGYENASKEFNRDIIKTMIEKKEKENKWKFLFLAANQDAVTVGGSFGIAKGQAMTYNATDFGANIAFSSVSSNITNYRSVKTSGVSLDDATQQLNFKDEDRKSATEK